MDIVGFQDYEPQGRRLATATGGRFHCVEVHYFPDGESRVTLPETHDPHLVLIRTLDNPNDKLVELILIATTARERGVRRLTLVCPYLCYMRQDKAFVPGEAISQQIIGRLLGELFDDLVTVDPHLHRVTQLETVVTGCDTRTLTAASLISQFLAQRLDAPFLLGPDEESRQWVEAVACHYPHEHGIAQKKRLGDHEVEIEMPDIDLQGRHVVLIDDVASTGRTLAEASAIAFARGAARVDAMVVHPLFVPGAEAVLEKAGISDVWSTDSITHMSNTIRLAPLLAAGLRSLC